MIYSPTLFCTKSHGFDCFQWNMDPGITEAWLRALDTSIGQHSWLQRKNFSRLGLYSEALLKFCFETGADAGVIPYRLIAHGLQINHRGNTVGECDFLIEDQSGKVIHLELAVKFYLQHQPAETSWHNWIGPNNNDRLDIKLQRLFGHQLPLLQHAENQALLSEHPQYLNISQAVLPQYLIKGRLFYHFGSRQHAATLPQHANQSLLTGFWARVGEFTQFYNDAIPVSVTQCLACEKLDWLSGPESQAKPAENPLTYIENIYKRARKNNRALPPIYFLLSNEEHQLLQCPFIVVPDYWPGIISPPRRI